MFKVRLGGDLILDESKIYQTWIENDCFKFDRNRKDNFIFVLPPPNANGELHLGHSFGYTIMDCIGRFQRMMGMNVLLLPGKDHAGIQTQVIFEKILKERGIDVQATPREELFKMCYDFCMDRAQYMRAQEQSLGLGCDWEYELFTLDPRVSQIVLDTFVRLFKDNHAYRANRIVNWSVVSQTSISDIEVEYVEKKGNLYYVLYPWADGGLDDIPQMNAPEITEWEVLNDAYLVPANKELPEFALIDGNLCTRFKSVSNKQNKFEIYLKIFPLQKGLIVATTRPETMLGDVALAVHPDDPRYSKLINRAVHIPVIDRQIPVLAHNLVDPTYGTGALKVTPAHDFKDFQIGKELGLDPIQVIGKDGKITQAGGKYAGLSTTEAREQIVADLKLNGLLLKCQEIQHNVPVSERAKDIIEPLITEQWWINFDKVRYEAIRRIKYTDELEVYPPEFKDLIIQWFEKLQDWNVSRQLWWGHRIPAWFKEDRLLGVSLDPIPEAQQDPDTFDTWFSSGQWAYSTLAATGLLDLENSELYSHNYPTHLMVMGRDILFFWACRMILLGLYRTNKIPFKKLYFHGLILDEHGQKMSKSRGNGIEPKTIQERFGTDVLRLALLSGFTPGRDIRFGTSKCESWSKFENKLVNAIRFITLNKADYVNHIDHPVLVGFLNKTKQKIAEFQRGFEIFELSSTLDNIYSFFWDDFCDWLIELSKALLKTTYKAQTYSCLLVCAQAILTMLHPFAPFITEFLHSSVLGLKNLLAKTKFNELLVYSVKTADTQYCIDELYETVKTLRRFKAITKDNVAFSLDPACPHEKDIISTLSGCQETIRENGFTLKIGKRMLQISVRNVENFKAELVRMKETTKGHIQRLERLLNSEFESKAPADVVRKEKEKLESLRSELSFLTNAIVAVSSQS